jgi:hypothetical protein
MTTKIDKIEIEGKTYVPIDQVKEQVQFNNDGLEYVVVRTYSAGVHIGFLKSREGKEVVLQNSRRIYYWEGANTLTDIALIGSVLPDKCKITAPLQKITLTEAIEIIPVTKVAYDVLGEIPYWTKG